VTFAPLTQQAGCLGYHLALSHLPLFVLLALSFFLLRCLIELREQTEIGVRRSSCFAHVFNITKTLRLLKLENKLMQKTRINTGGIDRFWHWG